MRMKRSDRPEPTAEQSSVEGSPPPPPCLSGACYETTFDRYRIMMAAFSAVARSGRYVLRSPCREIALASAVANGVIRPG